MALLAMIVNIYTLTVNGFAEVDEDIKFSTGTPTGDRLTTNNAGVHTGVAVAYSKADDAFTFQFQLVAVTTANVAATLGASSTNTQEQGRIDYGSTPWGVCYCYIFS